MPKNKIISFLALAMIPFLSSCFSTRYPSSEWAKEIEKTPQFPRILKAKHAEKLVGPFKWPPFRKTPKHGRDRIPLRDGDKSFFLIFRGTKLSEDKEFNGQLPFSFNLYRVDSTNQIYIWKESLIRLRDGNIKGIAYVANNILHTHNRRTGEVVTEILGYRMLQSWPLLKGQIILDKTDTDYPLYNTFLEYEAIAKRHKKGVWAKQ